MNKLKGIYIIKFDNGIKFGISDNCYERIKVYQSPWCRPIELAIAIEVAYPRIVEELIKKRFKTNLVTSKSVEFVTGVEFDIIKQFANSVKKSKGDYLYNPIKYTNKPWIQLFPLNELPPLKLTPVKPIVVVKPFKIFTEVEKELYFNEIRFKRTPKRKNIKRAPIKAPYDPDWD